MCVYSPQCDLKCTSRDAKKAIFPVPNGTDAYTVQEAISGAFVSLAYTGSPSTEELPWAAYESGSHNLMKFNVESGCVDHDTTAYTEILKVE